MIDGWWILVLAAGAVGFLTAYTFSSWSEFRNGVLWAFIFASLMTWVVYPSESNIKTWSDRAKAAAESDAREKVLKSAPYVIREADGCKVYTFWSEDRWHYFTKCGNSVTTDSSWTTRQGKRTITHTETIGTESK
jgi:hypothetical protein